MKFYSFVHFSGSFRYPKNEYFLLPTEMISELSPELKVRLSTGMKHWRSTFTTSLQLVNVLRFGDSGSYQRLKEHEILWHYEIIEPFAYPNTHVPRSQPTSSVPFRKSGYLYA